MSVALIVEIALTALLAATLVYCAILERRLATLRKGQDGFKNTVAELNAALASAQTSIRQMKSSAASASSALDERLAKARGLADELSLLTVSGERIAERMERAVAGERPRPSSTPTVLANRLDALRQPNSRPHGGQALTAGQAR